MPKLDEPTAGWVGINGVNKVKSDKGRIIIPTRYREFIRLEKSIYLILGTDRVFVNELRPSAPYSIYECGIPDKQGRLLIPDEYSDSLGWSKQEVLHIIGQGDHFTICNEKVFKELRRLSHLTVDKVSQDVYTMITMSTPR